MSRRPRVWVVSELYYPEMTSTGRFLTGIAEALAVDHDVRVLCSQPTYSARGVLAPRSEHHNGVYIRRVRSTRFPKDVLPLRLFNMMTFTAGVLGGALRGLQRGDVMIVVSTPPVLPFAAAVAAVTKGARLIVLVHDVYPDVLIATGMLRSGSAPVRMVERIESWLYSAAERIIVLGRDARELLARRTSLDDDRFVVIPNWGEVNDVRPRPRSENPLLAQLGLRDRFVVQFMGNMGRTHGVDTVVEAAALLRDEPDIAFLFVGWGARRAWLEQTVLERGLRNVHVLDPCEDTELETYLNACDVSVIPLVPGMTGVSVPSRMYNVLAAGRPIIAVAEPASELARVVRELDSGWQVEPGNAHELAQTIRLARSRESERRQMSERARAAAEEHYSREAIGAQYRDLLSSLLPDATPQSPPRRDPASFRT